MALGSGLRLPAIAGPSRDRLCLDIDGEPAPFRLLDELGSAHGQLHRDDAARHLTERDRLGQDGGVPTRPLLHGAEAGRLIESMNQVDPNLGRSSAFLPLRENPDEDQIARWPSTATGFIPSRPSCWMVLSWAKWPG